jgi:hypothetical protein
MKALTVCQPFASLFAMGLKRVENRRWATDCRGPILIHAGKSPAWMDSWHADGGRPDIVLPDPLPFGAIVARAHLIDCCTIGRIEDLSYAHPLAWLKRHPHAVGPWCWILGQVQRLADPIPYRGAQGIFDVPDRVLAGAKWAPAYTSGVCRVCNCTDAFGCDEGCEWVEPDLCSACVMGSESRAES